ncbi:hypothetical protein VTN00DRAFT_5064 [Thermoascus crustaceus]|uniref:uncharacterized protein n=1 Tax=Thermoascus crustaceus TaxID=5088 RepID=UPI0037435A0B
MEYFPLLILPSPDILRKLTRIVQPASPADAAALVVFILTVGSYLSRGITWDKPDPYRHLWYERPQLKDGAIAKARRETRNIAQKLEESGKDIVIFWGSQSGTAEGFANRLARECYLRFAQEVLTADLSDYDPQSIALIPVSKLAIFILSTYGEGDPSDNTASFCNWIEKSEDVSLANLRYVAFGLGNSNYKYYNRVVDVVVEAIGRLGATAFMPVGKANDAEGGTEEDFIAWKDDLFTTFRTKLGFQEREVTYTPTLYVQEDESLQPIDLYNGKPFPQGDNSRKAAKCSPIKALRIYNSEELFNTQDRYCLHMEFDLSDHPELTYKTGDHLAIWPGNPDAEVERLLQVLGLSSRRNTPICIKSLDSIIKVKVPSPTTIDAAFRYYLEICAPVNRDSIVELAQFAPTPDAKSYLLRLGQDKAFHADFINRTRLNMGRLLQLACPSGTWTALPLSCILEIVPRMQPRYYSISSSSTVSPRKPSITVAVSPTPLPKNPPELIHGVTSNYLLTVSRSLQRATHPHGITYRIAGPSGVLQDGKVFAYIRRSKFKLPKMSTCPLIMVAAGTGLAPFRAFITERNKLHSIGKPVGEMILFFGCRRADEDFIYRSELEDLEATLGGRIRIVTAFSRQDGQPKRYVQDMVSELAHDVNRLIDEGANVYICGRAAMAREVEKAVGQSIKNVKGWTEVELSEWSNAAKRTNKWQEDVWG